MQISSENYIDILTGQLQALTIENAQLKAYILDLEKKIEEQSPSAEEEEK